MVLGGLVGDPVGRTQRARPHEDVSWLRIFEASRAFHQAVEHLHRPDCLDARDDWWAVADRVACGEHGIQFRPVFENLGRRLQAAVGPLGSPQIVHGDLTGNVLLSPTVSFAVIDVSPYWRPPEYAEGVVSQTRSAGTAHKHPCWTRQACLWRRLPAPCCSGWPQPARLCPSAEPPSMWKTKRAGMTVPPEPSASEAALHLRTNQRCTFTLSKWDTPS